RGAWWAGAPMPSSACSPRGSRQPRPSTTPSCTTPRPTREGGQVSRLSGLVDAVVAEPVVAAALEQAREPASSTLDLSAPPAIRPVLYAALAAAADHGGADPPGVAGTGSVR